MQISFFDFVAKFFENKKLFNQPENDKKLIEKNLSLVWNESKSLRTFLYAELLVKSLKQNEGLFRRVNNEK